VLALVPLATLLLAVLQRQERFRVGALGGALVALAGIAVMSREPLRGSVPVLSLLAAVGSALCSRRQLSSFVGFLRSIP